jgi:hypothetical protein
MTAKKKVDLMKWFSVRSVYQCGAEYEERLTLHEAAGFKEALDQGEDNAKGHAAASGTVAIYVQVCPLRDRPSDGAEVYSQIRRSQLPPHVYLDAFIDTGAESLRPDLEDEAYGDLLRERLGSAGESPLNDLR